MSSRPTSPTAKPSRAFISGVVALGAALGLATGSVATAVGQSTPTSTPAQAPTPNPGPPKVSTSGAEALSRTGGTVTGSVTPGGAEASYVFEYGTSTSYGLRTAAVTVPAGDAPVVVKRALSGLTVETTYHYRLVATNAAGTARGSDRTFRTNANPKSPSVSTQAPINAAATSATFVAKINPQGQETTYSFQYGRSSKFGLRSPSVSAGAGTATVDVNTAVTGLVANSKYYVRVVARNATGTKYGNTRSFTTPRGLTGVSASATPNPVVWSQNAAIAGTVGGAGVGGVGVALLRQDFPFNGPFVQVATQTASSAGAFSFQVGPLYRAARFQVTTSTTPAIASPVVNVGGALYTKVRVIKRKRTSVQLSGLIYPAANQARVSIQRKSPKGRWVRVKTVGVTALKERSRFRTTVPRISRRSQYRAVVRPRDGGAHVTTTTRSVTVAARR